MSTIFKVSIIIPIYNVEKYLRKSVDSALNQTYQNTEIILIDDGSTDSSPMICDEYAKKYDNVRAIHKNNGGSSSARNRGIEEVSSDTDYIIFFDSDDELVADAVEKMVAFSQSENADAVFPDRYIKTFEDGTEELCFHFPEFMYISNPRQFAEDVLIQEGRAWRAHSLLYSSRIIKDNRISFPEGHIGEDFTFNLRFLSFANKISFYNQPTVKYLKRNNSITTSFRSDFEQEIWFIDRQASEFVKANGLDDLISLKKVDALLYRNMVIFLFKIMSNKNPLPYKDKKKMAQRLLCNPNSRGVIRTKQKVPYFSSKKKTCCLSIAYFYLRHHLDSAALLFISVASCFNKSFMV